MAIAERVREDSVLLLLIDRHYYRFSSFDCGNSVDIDSFEKLFAVGVLGATIVRRIFCT